MLTVKLLKEILDDYPDDALVYLSSDSEGNFLSAILEVTEDWVTEGSDGSWSFFSEYDEEDFVPQDSLVDPADEGFLQCVVLWPH